MSGNTGRTTTADGGKRRVGQAVVVAICIFSLVVAGALAPTVGSPFTDGPAVNASELAAASGFGQNPNASGVPQSARDVAGKQTGSTSKPEVIGSPDNYAVGGKEPLSGFRNQSGGIQFVVQAPENTYYRVGAYQSFDGYGWSRSGEKTAFSGAVPGTTPRGERLEARVTLNSSAFAVPVPWKPTTVDGPTPLSVRETGGIVPRQSLAPNQSFTVTAVQPTRDPAILSETGYDYPDSIESQYLTVSENVSERVVDHADEITAGASNPYEEAKAIESWLEANKEYSLNATTDPGRPVTRQFLFEMEEGYCQYFASSMAVMLRSQGIPARYVVGYAPGTQIGEDTYAVTGSKAHAWVEVYFEGVGWVRFDPTPAAGREAADESVASREDVQENFESSNVSDSMNLTEGPPSTNETGEDSTDTNETETGEVDDGESTDVDGTENGSVDDGDPTDGNTTGNETDGGDSTGDDAGNDADGGTDSRVRVRLNRTAAPGVDVTVTVTKGGSPVIGAEVYFNGEFVGVTDVDGEVVATVPYTKELEVRVTDVESSVQDAVVVPTAPGGGASAARFDAAPLGRDALDPPDNESNDTNERFEVSTDMTFALGEDPVPGERIPVQVSIDGRAVPSARVSVDGEYVGETNDTGWIDLELPADRSSVTVSARRGEVNDSATVELLTTVNVTVDGGAVPGSTMRVTAVYDGEPLPNAPVRVDGERVALTDGGGFATVPVPVEANETVTVTVSDGVLSGSASKPVATNATLEFEDPPSPNGTVVVLVTAENRSVANATVRVENDTVGTTDRSGLADVSVPANATGNVTVTATLGSLSASREVDLFEPNVTVTPAYLVMLPGAPVTVNVTDAGEPVGDAAVSVGQSTSWTDENGTVEAGLPFANAVSVSVSALSASTSTRLNWLFANLLGVLALGAGVAVVGVGSVYGRGRLGRLARRVERFVRDVGRAAMDALFAVASRLDDLLARLPALPALVESFVQRLVRAPVATLQAVFDRVRTAVAALVMAVVAWLRALAGADEAASPSTAGTASAGASEVGDGGSSSLSLAAAWRVLVELVAPSRLRTRTPGEIARLAVEKGLPSGPVRTVTDAYRATVYGGADPDGETVERARAAAEELERSAGSPSAESAGSTPSEGPQADSTASGRGDGVDGEPDAVRPDGGDAE